MEHRHYELEINYYDQTDLEELYNVINKNSVDYYAWCFEGYPCDTHHPHIHASIHFKSSVKETAFRNYFTKKHHTAPVHNAKHFHEYIRGYEKVQGKWELKCAGCSICEEKNEPCNNYFTLGEIPETGKKKQPTVTQKVVEALQSGKTFEQIEILFPAYTMTNKRRIIEWLRDHKPPHDRKIITMDYKDRFEFPPNASICYVDDDCSNGLSIYNYEKTVVFFPIEAPHSKIMEWLHGFPPTIRRGFELIKFDPENIVLLYDTPRLYASLRKMYKKYLHNI